MIYERRYIQFNDLVFDGVDMISDWDGDLSFKGSSTEYAYAHGAYRPFKRNYLFVQERTVSMTITLNLEKIPCDERKFYIRFVNEQLSKPGKLWSIKNDTLMWAVAAVGSISENYSRRQERLVYDVNFVIPGGIWYKADGNRTFLVPWDICSFMDCLGYKDVTSCDCCDSCADKHSEHDDCSCCCDELTEDMELCKHYDELQSWYGCDVHYRIVYDCETAERFKHDKYLGQRLCVKDICGTSVIAGQIYSDTEIPTEDVTVILHGKMVSPWININGNLNVIEGEYDGTLILKPNGDAYYTTNDKCCDGELLDPSVWSIPEDNKWGWEIVPGNNRVIIHLNACCSSDACVWLQYDSIGL